MHMKAKAWKARPSESCEHISLLSNFGTYILFLSTVCVWHVCLHQPLLLFLFHEVDTPKTRLISCLTHLHNLPILFTSTYKVFASSAPLVTPACFAGLLSRAIVCVCVRVCVFDLILWDVCNVLRLPCQLFPDSASLFKVVARII